MSCDHNSIKIRAKNWINQTQKDCPNKLLLVIAMIDATTAPTVGESDVIVLKFCSSDTV